MKIKNGFSYEKNEWTYISIKGKPKERGYAYGYLVAKQFAEMQKMLEFFILESYGETWEYMIKLINEDFKEMTKNEFSEFYEEMEGIADGCTAAGTKTTIDEIIAWNFYMSMSYWYGSKTGSSAGKEGGAARSTVTAKDRCSAFIAVGDWTEDGKIVVAHNSFSDFIDGQYSNIILDVNPSEGSRFIMQTSPCWIWSGTDFFVTDKGIIGTETTIGGFNVYEKKIPIAYRIRKAMQYGKTLDDYVKILLEGNSGDYANSWLFGDTNTNEIMRIELGLKYNNIERTKNGFFIGFNAPYDPKIRNLECGNSGMYDIRRHQGARLVRLNDLMDKHKGKINLDIAKEIIADHYDVYLKKEDNPCARCVCSHYELDAREYMSQADRPKPFSPHGACDGCVCDTTMAKKMSFSGRFGNSCGMPFIADEFFKKNRQWDIFKPYIKDRPSAPWTDFAIEDRSKSSKSSKTIKTILSKKNKQNSNKKTLKKIE
jgi:hypothetical protein